MGATVVDAGMTYLVMVDALPFTHTWASTGDEWVMSVDDGSGDEVVTDWCRRVSEDESHPGDGPGVVVDVDHRMIVQAMKRIIEERDQIRLADSIIDQIQVVYNAADADTARDEMCQLDVIGFDAIVQVAVLGQVIYG